MTQTRFLKTAGVITAFVAVVLAGMMRSSKRVRARDAASAVAVSYAHAPDDIASVAPEHCKLLKEDTKFRVIHCNPQERGQSRDALSSSVRCVFYQGRQIEVYLS
jgi:hypothetical protein